MSTREEKTEAFLQAMRSHAEEQSRRIHEEVETYKKERLSAAERQVFEETHRRLAAERQELTRKLRSEFSERDRAGREELLRRREEMADEVISAVREQLCAFCGTPAYGDYLHRSVQRLAAALPAEGTVYELGETDAPWAETVRGWLPEGSSLRTVPDIAIGGLRAVSLTAHRLCDDTLDAALQEERERFYGQTELSIDIQPMGLTDAL